MSYQKVNIIGGWTAFFIALITYILTVEPTASYWDAGEFIACSSKLQVPHPPGAPFFLLTGRMFSLLGGDDLTRIAYHVNMLSVVSSAFFVMFIFWIITHLCKRILKTGEESISIPQTIMVMGAGMTGALACTFSDSFWFSAVEAEVYAMSAFFTGFVFWAILKWENLKEEDQQARWLILIAYMMGLSIGVHLLNLVALPVLGLIIYFKKFEKTTRKGIIYTLLASTAALLIILEGIIPGLPSVAGKFEVFFVNGLGLPFGSGVIFFAIAFIGLIAYGLIYSIKKNKYVLNTALLSLIFIIIGYSSYMMIPIRSAYNPPIDENNPEEIMSFVSYLKREQYGSRPLFKGPYYTAGLIENKKGAPIYMRGEDKYVVKDYKVAQVFDSEHTTILPRMYSSDPNHIKKYREVTGLKEGEKPGWGENFYYLITHQLGHQYFRYFMWNFAGRESDIQGAGFVGVFDAFQKVPEVLAGNKGRNIFYGLPLLLGLLGMLVQYKKDIKLFSATALLFFMSGIAIVLYLNTPPIEPRERDYIYAGSFYVFTIWIGFGVLAVFDMLSKAVKQKKTAAIIASVLCLGVPVLIASQTWDDHDRSDRYFSVDSAKNYLSSCAPNAIIFTGGDNDTFPLWYAQEVEGFRRDIRVVVLSYYNTDWYIEQTARSAYESAPLPYSLEMKHYRQGGLNDYLPVFERDELKDKAISASLFLSWLKQENPQLQIQANDWTKYNFIPSSTLFLNVDTAKAKEIIPEDMHENIGDQMILKIKGRSLIKGDLAFLDLLVTNNWERPIYLNNTSISQLKLDMKDYIVQEGMAYRVVPARNPDRRIGYPVNTEVMYENVMNKFTWTNLDNPSIYYSPDYLGFALNSRSTFNTLARNLIDEAQYERASDVLKKCLEVMPDKSIPYDEFSAQQISLLLEIASYKTGTSTDLGTVEEVELANHIAENVSKWAGEWLDVYLSAGSLNDHEIRGKLFVLNEISRAYRADGDKENASKYETLFEKYYTKIESRM
ncbi:MAG: DUF2723 domain-containing protein [Ekhidna sp.]|nr:DUF2723 domain-containing protein [Ekhidna sp.]